jgi:cytoskeletal protein CcmA (bactofilin family)
MKIIKDVFPANDAIQTIVGREAVMSGVIHTDNSIRFEGDFSGKIYSQGIVYVGVDSVLKATISASKVIVAGKIEGNIDVIDTIDIHSTGEVDGNINGKNLIVNEGATFKGKVNMDIITPGKIDKSLY